MFYNYQNNDTWTSFLYEDIYIKSLKYEIKIVYIH